MATKISILGGGAMATACSVLLSENSAQFPSMWVRNPTYARRMRETRVNDRLLPGIAIPDRVEITSDVEEAARGADFLVVAVPTAHLRGTLRNIAASLPRDRPVISVVKGIENGTFLRPSEIIGEVLKTKSVVALCGPSHAEEIARRLPASVVAACPDLALGKAVQSLFSTDRFRVYTNRDLVGVELAGALKNIVAIAAGISDGLGYGDNAKSALMTRGLVEMTRFGSLYGAEPETFFGLAGVGDLITTCISRHSRNRMVGERLGRGETLQQILASVESVAEGVTTTKSVHDLAQRESIEMPITSAVHGVLFEGTKPEEATDALMQRPPRSE